MASKTLKNYHYPIFSIAALFLFVMIHTSVVKKLKLQPAKQIQVSIAPPAQIHLFSFGYSEIFANMLWIRSIQDFDFCDRPGDNTGKPYLVCTSESWLYKQLNAIVDLSPQFRMPLATGPLALSVLITDVEGATKLFLRAMIAFPLDWKIYYRAAYHAMIEEKKPLKAANLLTVAAKNGGPQWLYALAGRMYVQGGAEELGLDLARSLDGSDEMGKDLAKRIRQRVSEQK